MEDERTLKIDLLLGDLAAYLTTKYDLSPAEAAGIVMTSPYSQQLEDSTEPLPECSIEELAKNYII